MRYNCVETLDTEIVISFLIQPAIRINLTIEACSYSARSHIKTLHTHAENELESPVAEIIITRACTKYTNIIYI